MTSSSGPHRHPGAAGLVGLPADGLAQMLEDVLTADPLAKPVQAPRPEPAEPELPGAFAGEGAPYALEDLLSGLPPAPEEEEPGETVEVQEPEPALLLTEVAPPDMFQSPGGWTAPPPETPDEPSDDEAEPLVLSAEEELRAADPGGTVDAVMDMAAAEPAPAAEILVLTNAMEVAPVPAAGEPVWDASALTMGNIVDALRALAVDEPVPATPPVAGDETPLPATTEFPVSEEEQADGEPEAEPAEAATLPAEEDLAPRLTGTVEALIAAHRPTVSGEGKGDPALPERLDALAVLLADPPPAEDFAALDALYACWPKGTQDSASRALLGAAHNLSRNFGLPDKLPMASAKAWRMLSPTVFEEELAQRLRDVGDFIADWQKTQRTFLILEFGEIELIEHLFEIAASRLPRRVAGRGDELQGAVQPAHGPVAPHPQPAEETGRPPAAGPPGRSAGTDGPCPVIAGADRRSLGLRPHRRNRLQDGRGSGQDDEGGRRARRATRHAAGRWHGLGSHRLTFPPLTRPRERNVSPDSTSTRGRHGWRWPAPPAFPPHPPHQPCGRC
ncbi:MAG: hypothetical protein NVV74_12995 [Magnetospirillum sp.]|nr:hypothetical protein [Magnetospirillum sp.]